MKIMRSMMIAATLLASTILVAPASAQTAPASASAATSHTPGSVWMSSRIEIMPGQFENYMDWLKNNWKPNMEFLKAEGWLLSYHVLQTNHRREGEPHLSLVQEWRDYPTTAQLEELNNKWQARTRINDRVAATQNGERAVMRRQIGTVQFQELVIK